MPIYKPSKKVDELLKGWHLIYPIVPSERDGPYEDYYENGQLKEKSTFVAGEVNGPFESYYENGQLELRGTNVAGKLDGPYEAYDETGQLTTKGTYKEGLRIGKWIEDGKSESYFDQYERWAAQPGFGQFTVRILFIALVIWSIWF